MHRLRISTRQQIGAALVALMVATGSLFGLTQFAVGASTISSSVMSFASRQAEVSAMEQRVAALRDEVSAVKLAASEHAARLEKRQAFLAALLKGDGNSAQLSALLPAQASAPNAQTADIAALFSSVDRDQLAMAASVRRSTDARYAQASGAIARLGVAPVRFVAGAMGGPYEPLPAGSSAAAGKADPQFRALFNSWKRLDQLQTSMVSIPSFKPVENVVLTSGYGVRSDPFRGGRAMHAGIDIPGAHATQIFATADGFVGRSGWIGGYGNMIELEHGKGIQTRYGHLSAILVTPGSRIKRGQLIGLMGSTGRSTGTHLHYEVRLDGHAVNPMPFLQSTDYLVAIQTRAANGVALGGPDLPVGRPAGSK